MTITGNQHPLFNAQLDLEEEMRSLGIKKFREQIEIAQKKGQESRTLAVRRIMGNAHQDMVEAVEAFVATASSGKAGPKHSALKFIKLVGDNDIVAHIAMRAVLDGVSQRERLTHCAIKLATMLEDEVHFETFKEQLPVAYKAMHKKAEKSPDARHRRNAMLMPARKMGAKFDDWSPREKLLIGTKLIELFVETTGLAQITRMSEGAANTQIYVEATPATLTLLSSSRFVAEVWGGGGSGGAGSPLNQGAANGNAGGTSTLLSQSAGGGAGGGGGNANVIFAGGAGGAASGGSINDVGQAGETGRTSGPTHGGYGGSSPSGGAGGPGSPNYTGVAAGQTYNGVDGSVPGGGGSGVASLTSTFTVFASSGGGSGARSYKRYLPSDVPVNTPFPAVVGAGGVQANSGTMRGGLGAAGGIRIT